MFSRRRVAGRHGPSTRNLHFRYFLLSRLPCRLFVESPMLWLKPLRSDSGRQEIRNRGGLKGPWIQDQRKGAKAPDKGGFRERVLTPMWSPGPYEP